MITNSLAIHYLQSHRDEIPDDEWIKLENLKNQVEYKTCTGCKQMQICGKYKRCSKCRNKNKK